MTNKLVVIIKSLKVLKIKKILLYEMKFLVPPQDPNSLCPLPSTEFVDPPPNKIPGYTTGYIQQVFKDDLVLNQQELRVFSCLIVDWFA
jgi:hypothetical protein